MKQAQSTELVGSAPRRLFLAEELAMFFIGTVVLLKGIVFGRALYYLGFGDFWSYGPVFIGALGYVTVWLVFAINRYRYSRQFLQWADGVVASMKPRSTHFSG